MAIYAVGDIQGCYNELQQLLKKITFNQKTDTLWFCGDLISRGPKSLEALRFIQSLGEHAICVLGNHDLHMLAIANGVSKTKDQGLKEILDAPDKQQLLHWLRHRPLLHHDAELGYTLVHAGIYPAWSFQQAQDYALELEEVLQSDQYHDFLRHMYGNKPDKWHHNLNGWDRYRFICNSFTRMRYCDHQLRLSMTLKGKVGSQPDGWLPWFEVKDRKSEKQNILFGHWSTLGMHKEDGIYALDSGCVWGGQLTALQIDTDPPRFIQINCPETCLPGTL